MAWLIAMTNVGLEILDDICDKSSVREGKACWYLLPEVGKTASLRHQFHTQFHSFGCSSLL